MHIVIIGGGASGMVAALCAAKNNQVTILEQRDRIGRKLLATGNGRCNMTNTDQSLCHYHGLKDEAYARGFAGRILKRCGSIKTLSFFQTLGIEYRDRNGYIYPASEQASAVLDVLRFALKHADVNVITDCRVDALQAGGNTFTVQTSQGAFQADKVILCAGSKAGIPKDCTEGYALAKSLSHTVIGPLPALVQLCSDEKICKALAGIRTQAGITLLDEDDRVLAKESGEIQFTAYGISGIPTMQISYLAAKELENGRTVSAEVDLMPDKDENAVFDMLQKRRQESAYKTAEQFLIGLFHKNLGIHLMKSVSVSLTAAVSTLTDEDLWKLCKQIKLMPLPVKGTKSFADAQVCAGGVDLFEVTDDLESKKVPGLYFAGEILDVHGDCGGYNLQWAFSTGMLAGTVLAGEQI